MTNYARTKNGVLLDYPYSHETLLLDNPNTKFDKRHDLVGWFNQTESATIHGNKLEEVVEGLIPEYDPRTHKIFKSAPTLVEGAWTEQWSIVELSEGELEVFLPTVLQIKEDDGRRILEIAPEWMQRNLTAQAAVLAKIGQDNWTTDQADEWAAGELIWASIQAIRTASNMIEAIDPIPYDALTNEDRWS